ncbi:DUF2460 domain-containing protein [Paraburkholderia tuberum]|uniref:TIGR02217 family protein n=1 Tax=Paraburkholderia tuberum TaxID=157910 RepID=A0A1H1JAN6_9BURK|nr:DUF2460 domain-containing protein [Paraburkholderia tuberum]SDR47057.1 TIGR02217 family protein [Paraburkholderia tuberum]
MTFLESPRFPDNIAFGATVGPTFSTVVATVYSGREQRTPAWTQSRLQFEVGRRAMNAIDTAALDAFFRAAQGKANGFRIKDWTDYLDAGAGVLIQTTTPGVWQMAKNYVAGALSNQRLIRKPVYGLVAIQRGGVAAIAGGSAGNVSIDSTTGLVTFVADSAATCSAWSAGATTSFMVPSVPAAWTVGKQLSFSGITGDAGGVLNGKSVAITAINGTTVTVSAATTGDTLTGGTAQLYPQPNESLTWTGQFDVPVRFDTDQMQKQILDRSGPSGDLIVTWDSVPIIEIRV